MSKYNLNDPLFPITVDVAVQKNTVPPFTVSGYVSDTPKPGPQVQAYNCQVAIGNCLTNRIKTINRTKKITSWAAVSTLGVSPRAGKDLNAFYDRRRLAFFYYPVGNQVLYTADSSDVVTHELGHALLDAMRPDFWSVQSLEIWAFHEAFADITAILAMLDFPQALEIAIKESNGNLRKSNIVSRLAEQLGAAVYGKQHLYLRDAVNNFKYQNPNILPPEAPDDRLCSECHSFGRVFLGTWWEIMCNIYDVERKRVPLLEALTIAKNTAADYLFKAIVQTPRVAQYHYAVARAMLLADQANGGKYQDAMVCAFQSRNMTPPKTTQALANVNKKEIMKKATKQDIVAKMGKVTAITLRNSEFVKLADYYTPVTALSNKSIDFSKIQLELPIDQYYEFDDKGQIQHHVSSLAEDQINETKKCLAFILQNDNVGKNRMWKVSRNKLTRNHIL